MDDRIKSVYLTITLIGIVSMMGDIVYEGGRGIIPSYLQILGASAFVVGLVTGLGDFLGYAIRLISGYLSDRSGTYWMFMFIGYGLIITIPLLSITNFWLAAAFLVLMERLGKAIRAPARDAIVSIVSKGVGVGKAF
ncbi:MAG: MFS transporter, partial [Nitrososphaeria archaeon]